ncbi:MAG: hypothetical protein QXG39_03330 [Candidatus Aenigmatarchaeota archaeon]
MVSRPTVVRAPRLVFTYDNPLMLDYGKKEILSATLLPSSIRNLLKDTSDAILEKRPVYGFKEEKRIKRLDFNFLHAFQILFDTKKKQVLIFPPPEEKIVCSVEGRAVGSKKYLGLQKLDIINCTLAKEKEEKI